MSSVDKTFWWNALAMFYGGALGDALGIPFEFRYSRSIKQYHGKLEYEPMMISRFQGTRYGVVGQVSDDTEMTLALLRSINDNDGKYDVNKAILAYEEWANTRPMGMGRNTRALFSGVKTVGGYNDRYNKRFDPSRKGGINPKYAQSNGALMRCSPLALAPGRGYKNVTNDVNLTNPNELCRECNLIYVKVLRELLFGDLGLDPLETAKVKEVKEAIQQAKKGIVRDVTKKKGWVINAFYCAMYCLLNFEDYTQAVDWVIKLGGDTDTNASIAGALMGAKIGYILLVDPKVESKIVQISAADTSQGDFKRPQRYHPKTYVNITEDLASKLRDIELYNNNHKDILYYYKTGYTPVLYNNVGSDKFIANIFLNDDNIVKVYTTRYDSGMYEVSNIIIQSHDTRKSLSTIHRSPDDIETLFEGTPAELFASYRFLTRFADALVERALNSTDTEVRIINPLNPKYDILYDKKFFLINE